MAVAIHIVRIGHFTVDATTGQRIDKNSNTTKISTLLRTEQRHLVIQDDSILSSANYPTIDDYLRLEAAGGYTLRYMDQNRIVTYLA